MLNPKWLGATTIALALLTCCLLPAGAAPPPATVLVSGSISGNVSVPPTWATWDLAASVEVNQAANLSTDWKFDWKDSRAHPAFPTGLTVSTTPNRHLRTFVGLFPNGSKCTSTTWGNVHVNGDGSHEWFAQLTIRNNTDMGLAPQSVRLQLWEPNGAGGYFQPERYNQAGYAGMPNPQGVWTYLNGQFPFTF